MTLKRKDGRLSMKKIGLLTGIAAALFTAIATFPSAFGACQKALSPWTSMPDKVDGILLRVSRIEVIVQNSGDTYTTNKAMNRAGE